MKERIVGTRNRRATPRYLSCFRDDERLLYEHSNKDFLAFVEENRPLSSAKRQRSPNPRDARARQEVATENRRTLKKVMFVLIDRLLGAFPIGRGLINKVRWTLRIQGKTWLRSMPCRTGIQLQN